MLSKYKPEKQMHTVRKQALLKYKNHCICWNKIYLLFQQTADWQEDLESSVAVTRAARGITVSASLQKPQSFIIQTVFWSATWNLKSKVREGWLL